MKRKYREAMRAAKRQQTQRPDDDDDQDAAEAREWFEKWAATPHQQEDKNTEHTNELV